MLSKNCTRCKENKPLTLEYFPPHNKTKSGFDSWCRKCRSTYRSENCRGAHRSSISDADLLTLKTTVLNCIICGSDDKLVVDHDHITGQVRGMLCNPCNLGLGHFKDNVSTLESAIEYLRRN